MGNKFVFIGNEEEARTKTWGLKYGEMYQIEFPAFPPKGNFTAFIHTPNAGVVSCPYSSLKAFEAN